MILAVIRVRGRRKIRPNIEKTLEYLCLNRPNHCVLVDDSDQNKGMLDVVKNYVTYGNVDEETIYLLLNKRGKKDGKKLSANLKEEDLRKIAKELFSGKKTKDYANQVFRLSPPSKGYKDIKRSYPDGDLGKRDSMSLLIKRMA